MPLGSTHMDGRRLARALLPACAAALVLAPSADAAAPGGGGTTGGSSFLAPPKISKLECMSKCVGSTAGASSAVALRPGATVRVHGSGLDIGEKIVFLGSSGGADDVSAPVRGAT